MGICPFSGKGKDSEFLNSVSFSAGRANRVQKATGVGQLIDNINNSIVIATFVTITSLSF